MKLKSSLFDDPRSGGDFAIQIQRSHKRRKTLSIQVKGETVIVKVPTWASDIYVHNLIKARKSWIQTQLHHQKERTVHAAKTHWKVGDPVLYLGERILLESDFDAKQLKTWFMDRARPILLARTAHFSSLMGVSPQKVIVKEQRARWGSCSTDHVIRYNWKIIQAPLAIVDYLVVHELAHLKEKNHGPNFWDFVTRILPDALTHRKDLRLLAKSREFS